MTREQNFFQSFTTQLETYTSWNLIPDYDKKRLPLGSFPAFALDLGKTTYTKFNPAGAAIAGEQEFAVKISYILAHHGDDPIVAHSDIENLIEQFINNPVYSPPAISLGDTYSIDGCKLIGGNQLALPFEETRFEVIV